MTCVVDDFFKETRLEDFPSEKKLLIRRMRPAKYLAVCVIYQCQMGLTSLHDLLRFVTFVRLLFSIRSMDLFVASLMFMKCTIRSNFKQS